MIDPLEIALLAAIRHAVTVRENEVALNLVEILQELQVRQDEPQSSTIDLAARRAALGLSPSADLAADAVPRD
jgi:hypothetical protein